MDGGSDEKGRKRKKSSNGGGDSDASDESVSEAKTKKAKQGDSMTPFTQKRAPGGTCKKLSKVERAEKEAKKIQHQALLKTASDAISVLKPHQDTHATFEANCLILLIYHQFMMEDVLEFELHEDTMISSRIRRVRELLHIGKKRVEDLIKQYEVDGSVLFTPA
jgi:hypothetical protein